MRETGLIEDEMACPVYKLLICRLMHACNLVYVEYA